MLDTHCHQKLQRCVNTPQEILYTENGDILQYVLRRLAAR
jgi:hypothetical protein